MCIRDRAYTLYFRACLIDVDDPSIPRTIITQVNSLSKNVGSDGYDCLIGAISNRLPDSTIFIGRLYPDVSYRLFVFGRSLTGELSKNYSFTFRTNEPPAPLVFGFAFNKKPTDKELTIFICDLAYYLGVSDERLITEKYQRCDKNMYRRVLQKRKLQSENDILVGKFEEIVSKIRSPGISTEMLLLLKTFEKTIEELKLDTDVLINMGTNTFQRLLSLYQQYIDASTKDFAAIERIYLLADENNLEDLPENYASKVNSDMKFVYFLALHTYNFVPVLANLQAMSIYDSYPAILLDGIVLRGRNDLMLVIDLSLEGKIEAIVVSKTEPRPSGILLSAGLDGARNKPLANASFDVRFNETIGRNQQARIVFPNIPCGQELVIYYQIGIDIPTQFRPYPVIYSVQVNSTPCNTPINVTANSSSRNIPKGRLLLQVQESINSLYQRIASSSIVRSIKSCLLYTSPSPRDS
eukprot:TRINITY_DN3954_c0_g6_i1.p1 TRINITY_DN3954_c0_g6~~TRINITY_DN3954_c0_g6_i1.p1  ORF type:complete len:467 (-),score=75.04 TRINITY_DN3954_c0_g6_i1:50-1450(-)